MNKTSFLIGLFCLVASGALFAQDDETDDSQMSYVTVVTYHTKMPDGGSWDRFKEICSFINGHF